jgi:poly-gamma-glutamate synthase PgsB/CapB
VQSHARLLNQHDKALADQWQTHLLPCLEHLHRTAADLSVRRWAARSREKLWCQSSESRLALKQELVKIARSTAAGSSSRLPDKLLKEHDINDIGRVLSLMAETDFTYSLQQNTFSTRLHRGDKFGFRSWRFLHELFNPATDKRQAFSHTHGRIAQGSIRAQAGYLAEQTETRVPGEPVYFESEDGRRPYLPLVDDLIACLDERIGQASLRFFSSEGITELRAPAGFTARLRARTILTLRFASYARLRNWQESSDWNADAYTAGLKKLGFEIHFQSYPDRQIDWRPDPAVEQFFPAVIPFFDSNISDDFKQYFFSVYENTLYELSLFLAAVGLFFFGHHILIHRKIRQARKRLPLVIGGWGTRGKSGSERIKAALFNALGYSIVGKTTGTEAMFLHGSRFGQLSEMFLFRPYDKATIWEQANLVVLADKLDTDVFLWECMGLTPAYVRILQQDWMQDDLMTITNTYPDHEDIQGPAGVNIPEVMTEFIAPNSCLITTEEIMLPILREAARTRGTSVRSVGWLQAGLLTGDVLQRFPYDEHPKNIAMVLEMANELGIDHDFALKEMADRVVPDLGVLKTYPTACMQTRKLIFTNGMAANERLGFMGNWERMGFDRHNTLEHPGTWISTVINNREDRLPRSKVFAEILVRDIHADCHFLIGSNLHGFLTYLQESWDEHYRLYSLWPETKAATAFSAAQTFEKQALRMGVAVSAAQLQQRLQAMLSGMGLDADTCRQYDTAQPAALQELLAQHELGNYETAAVDYLQRSQEELQVYLAFSAKLTNAAPTRQSALNREALDLLWSWLQSRIVVIDDVHASGNEIIDRICQHTPPGFSNRILGAQNIKGPGLDFVYRWQAWDSCYQACQLLSSREEDLAERGLQTLSAFQEYGPLCEEHVKQTLERVTHSEVAQTEHFQSVLGLLKTNLALQLQELKLRSEVSRVGHGWVAQAWLLLESFLDAGDAVKRRKRANRIYQDLINQQISHARAVLELQKLNKLQKGGWLQQRFTNWLSGIFY